MHPVPCILHFERGFHDRLGLGGSADAGVLHRPASAISVTAHLHQ